MTLNNRIFSLTLGLSLVCGAFAGAHGESLFRGEVDYRENQPFTPHSVFSQPLPHAVGDMITIAINNVSTMTTNAELKISRNHDMSSNSSSIFNNTVRFFLDKLPFKTGGVQNTLMAPNMSGIDSSNTMNGKAESIRTTQLTDSITCQVVQVMPNGHLLVQGKKTIDINRDRQDIFVSGIVNPFYLDRNNQIASNRVGNFQLVQSGKGTVSRQQSDSLANKVYQFFD